MYANEFPRIGRVCRRSPSCTIPAMVKDIGKIKGN